MADAIFTMKVRFDLAEVNANLRKYSTVFRRSTGFLLI